MIFHNHGRIHILQIPIPAYLLHLFAQSTFRTEHVQFSLFIPLLAPAQLSREGFSFPTRRAGHLLLSLLISLRAPAHKKIEQGNIFLPAQYINSIILSSYLFCLLFNVCRCSKISSYPSKSSVAGAAALPLASRRRFQEYVPSLPYILHSTCQ